EACSDLAPGKSDSGPAILCAKPLANQDEKVEVSNRKFEPLKHREKMMKLLIFNLNLVCVR
ncbi:MAG: hypothetical protein ACM3NO_08625, partial [Deltaproteobacteria bacterium]